jgi:hypothetical protein
MKSSTESLPGLETLAQTPGILKSMLAAATQEVLSWKPSPERWSITEVLAHLLDMEVNALRLRARRIVEEKNPLLENIDQVAAAAEKNYVAQGPWETLEKFRQEREQSLAWFRQVPADALQRAGQHAEIGTITLENLLNQWAFHDLGHVRQVAELLRARVYYPHTGNFHKYYSVNP